MKAISKEKIEKAKQGEVLDKEEVKSSASSVPQIKKEVRKL
jgi:hypothetical protein